MSDVWFYQRGDQRHGPVSSSELKQLVNTGELQPSDLLWKEGMARPLSASRAKGLFPNATQDADRQTPPISPIADQGKAKQPPNDEQVVQAEIALAGNRTPNKATAGQKLSPKQLREAIVSQALAEDASLSNIPEIREFQRAHRELTTESQRAQERAQLVTAAISAYSPVEKSLEQRTKELLANEVELGKMAQSLGNDAFRAHLAGKIGPFPVFAERLDLHRKITALETEKLALMPLDNAGIVEKAKARAQQTVIYGKIKLAAMNEGSLETAIGRSLLHDAQEESVRCDQTSTILEAIRSNRSKIERCRFQVNEAQTALENKKAELSHSLGLATIENANTLLAELRQCQTTRRQKDKERVQLEAALPDILLAAPNLSQQGRFAELLNDLRLTGSQPSSPKPTEVVRHARASFQNALLKLPTEIRAIFMATNVQTARLSGCLANAIKKWKGTASIPPDSEQRLLPSDGAEWRRVGIGYATAALALFVCIRSMSSTPKPSASGYSSTPQPMATSTSAPKHYEQSGSSGSYANYGDERTLPKMQTSFMRSPPIRTTQSTRNEQPSDQSLNPNSGHADTGPCTHCNGLGKVYFGSSWEPCPTCNGTGRNMW